MVNSGRSISSLVISSLESFIVSAIFLPIFFAVSSSLESFTGVTSWVLYSQAFLVASSCLVVVVYISTTQKSSTIGGDYISIFGNANCGAVFLLLVYYLVFFLNSVPYRGLIDNTKFVITDGKYEVSERLDWIQTALGSSGWELRGSTLHVASVSNIPVIGQVYMGVSLSYIFISFLLSAYCAYSSTPDGYYTNLFMDTRSLTSTNIFVVFGMPQMVNIGFSGCIGPLELLNPSTYDSGSLYILSAIAFVFFGDYFIHLLISSASKKKKTSSKTYILQSIILTFMALVPTGYVMFLSSNATIITTISSTIIAGLSIFSCWSSNTTTTGNSSDKKKNHVEVATVVANNSNSSIMPAIGIPPDLKISKDSTTKKIENSSSPSSVVEKEASIIEEKKEDDKSNIPTNIIPIQNKTTLNNNNNRKEISFFTMSSPAATNQQTSSYQQRNFFGFNNNNNNGYQQLQRDNQQQQQAASSQNNNKPRRYLA